MPAPTCDGPGNFFQRLLHGVRRLHARSDWADFLGADWPEQIMQTGVTDDFHAKQGRSTGRCVFEAAGKQLVVYLKRHYRLPLKDGLLATLWPNGDFSPGMRERRNLEWARAQGLLVPPIAAAGEYLGPWGKLQSFLAVEELTDMLPLHEAIPLAARTLDPTTFRSWKAGLTRELARLARRLHDRHAFHKDLYLCHFFIARADTAKTPSWQGRVFMIDFHRLAHHPITGILWLSKDLGQLLFSSEIDGIDARDRLRFWRAYLGPDRRTWFGRWLKRVVLMRGRRYREHNAKRAS
jgi:heptose I phosphotransferase